MSRALSDQYQIPLRSLGRSRRHPLRSHSSSSSHQNGDLGLTEISDEQVEWLANDESPLIRKDSVLLLTLIF